MNLLDEGKALLANQKVREGTVNFLADCGDALLGNPIAIAKIMFSATKAALSLPDMLFWDKFESFLAGTDFSEDERLKFCAKLAEGGEKGDNPYRLIEAINRCDTKRKIHYLTCASRALAADFIDRATYFRIAQTITNCLVEDLEFLVNNISSEKDFEYSDTVQGLLNCGLMYRSVICDDDEDRCSFTRFAKTLNLYALSYDNDEKYSDPKKRESEIMSSNMSTKLKSTAVWG